MPGLTPSGLLPLGRWQVTVEEIEEAFVAGRPEPRPSIWREFRLATSVLQGVSHVCAAWLSGSFFTERADPGDIDCVYLVDERSRPGTINEAAVFDLFLGGERLRAFSGLRVDSYVLPWIYRPAITPDFASVVALQQRGFWDDFWQRVRHGPKGTTNPQDAIPKRGYLEVILDGYSATPP